MMEQRMECLMKSILDLALDTNDAEQIAVLVGALDRLVAAAYTYRQVARLSVPK